MNKAEITALTTALFDMIERDRGLVRSNVEAEIARHVAASYLDGEDVYEWDEDCGDDLLIKSEPEPAEPSAADVCAAREILMQRITPQQASAFKDDRVPAFFPPFIMPLPNGGDVGFKAIWSSPMSKVGITASFSNGTEHTFKPRDLVDRDVCEWNDHSKCAPLDLSPGSIHWINAPTDMISALPDGTLKRRHAIFDSEFDEEVEPEPDSPSDAEVEIKHATIDPFADLSLQDYREHLERARQQTLDWRPAGGVTRRRSHASHEFDGRNRNDTCDND
jgi:hypothetical protein